MKKIVLSLAFVLMGSFAFANTEEVKPATNIVAKETFVKTDVNGINLKRITFLYMDGCGIIG